MIHKTLHFFHIIGVDALLPWIRVDRLTIGVGASPDFAFGVLLSVIPRFGLVLLYLLLRIWEGVQFCLCSGRREGISWPCTLV